MSSIQAFSAIDINGQERPLSLWRGQVLLVVNVASRCGFTPQYEGLQALYEEFSPRGFSVLGFPCNQFGHQEPGDAEEIKRFCSLSYGVDFPMFAKIDVNGPDASALYVWLKKQKPGLLGSEAIKWNFTKFLIDRQGQVRQRYAPVDAPEKLRKDIAALL